MPNPALLQKYAQVAVEIGVGLQPGDRLLLRAPVSAAEFARIAVEEAYRAGAVSVDVFWDDDDVSRARFSHGSKEASEVVSAMTKFTADAVESGSHLLNIRGFDPSSLSAEDPDRVATYEKVNAEAAKSVFKALGEYRVAWSIVAAPIPSWATKVFPDLPPEDAMEALWEAIFRACRITNEDPVAAWREHQASLYARRDQLNQRQFSALRYEGPGTDLVAPLPADHYWEGGGASGAFRNFIPNIPTEEIFTAPHRLQTEGTVTATKPLSLRGEIVEGIRLILKEGRIVEASAESGQTVLDSLLATDDGSDRFGEVALVPQSSAVAAEGLIWQNTLYDENDACHIALGTAYPISLRNGVKLSPEERLDRGLNTSTVHVDFVVGSPRLTVYGVNADGTEDALISNGEWGFGG